MNDASRRQPYRSRTPWRQVRRIFGAVAVAAIVGVLLLEIFAWSLPQRFDEQGKLYTRLAALAFFVRVFQFHIAIALLLPIVIAFAARRRRSAVLGLALAACLLFPYGRDHAPKQPPRPASQTVRVMAINLYVDNRDAAGILRAIEEADPDVIAIAEMTMWAWTHIVTPHLLGRYTFVDHPRVGGDAIVLSRLPARAVQPALIDGSERPRTPVVFDIGGREVAFYAVHLVSPGRAWLIRHNREQVQTFVDLARAETRPMIIAGDFNFTSLTPNAFALRREGLRTSHDLAGFGLGNTWGPKWWPRLNRLPGVRIDHIFLSRELTATTHRVGPDTGSDHRPIIADVALSAGPP